MKNYMITIQYDGTSYNGWQRQGNTTHTIQEIVESGLRNILQQDIEIHGSGRTDAGVHAYGQTANFKCNPIHDLDVFLSAINEELPRDIRINRVKEVSMEFHSRLSATSKYYVYYIDIGEKPSVFRRKYAYHYPQKLDMSKMKAASQLLIGTHDFRGFSSERNLDKSCVRQIFDIIIEEKGNELILRYWGNGFLYNMVRILTGTLLEIGEGKKEIDIISDIFQNKTRESAGFMVPPNGLFLEKVLYEEK